jgi:cellulose synthase/poly-beta-1,6-N-acetylglucosamine synthase-like glycosyltransferase
MTVTVIADNCTDDTASVAQASGTEVYDTVANTDRKAGGLNQLLTRLLPEAGPDDAFLVMDADTILAPQFLHVAAQALEAAPALDAVGGVFRGEAGGGLIGLLQRNEYDRYSRDISRRQARVFVLTGTASLFRADTMNAVAQARSRYLPGTRGKVYDTVALTEDNELTLAVRTLGADLRSPQECQVRTELMPTWADLWRQRMRWQRGALENIGAYGLTSATARYWMQQTAIGYGTVALWAFFAVTAISVLAGVLVVFPFWLAIGAVFWVERVTTVWRSGWVPRLLAATLVVELAYDVFLQSVYIKSLFDIVTGRSRQWSHVATAGTEDVT